MRVFVCACVRARARVSVCMSFGQSACQSYLLDSCRSHLGGALKLYTIPHSPFQCQDNQLQGTGVFIKNAHHPTTALICPPGPPDFNVDICNNTRYDFESLGVFYDELSTTPRGCRLLNIEFGGAGGGQLISSDERFL